MSHHLIPVEGIIHGTCIDGVGTRVCEDMIRLTVNDRGYIQIDIAVVVPPIDKVNQDRLTTSLKNLMINSNRSDFVPFLSRQEKINSGFSETEPRDAFIATYVVSCGELLFEELTLSRAIGRMIDYEEYETSRESREILNALKLILRTKPELENHVTRRLRETFPQSSSVGFQTTLILSSLFNSTCRDASRKRMVRIPFIRRPSVYHGDTSFSMGFGLAKFSSCLRDPCSYVNAANLYHHLLGKTPIPFTKTELRKMIPVNTKNKKKLLKAEGSH